MKQCPKCQAMMPDESKFCTGCGTSFTTGTATSASEPPLEKTYMITDKDKPAGQPTTITQAAMGKTISTSEGSQAQQKAPGGKDDIVKIFETSGVCPNCYATLKKGSTQCEECGYRLTGTYCNTCGKLVEDGRQFCPTCKSATISLTGAEAEQVTVQVTPSTMPPPAGTAQAPAGTGQIPPAKGPAPLGATIQTPTAPPQPMGATSQATVFSSPAAPLSATIQAPVAPLAGTAAVPVITPAKPKGGKGLIIAAVLILGFLFVVAVGVGGWWWWSNRNKDKVVIPPSSGTTGTSGAESNQGFSNTTAASGQTTQTEDHKSKAVYYESIKDWAKASTEWEQYLEQQPGDAEALKHLANCYSELGNYPQALTTIQKYLSQNKADSEAYALAGQLCVKLGRLEEAKDYYLTAISHEPNNGLYHLELGKIFSGGGFTDKAIEQFREAVRLLPENENTLWLLTQELNKAGNKSATREAANTYVKNFPDGPNRAAVDAVLASGGKPIDLSRFGGKTGPTTKPPLGGQVLPTGETTRSETTPSPFVNVFLDGTALNLPGKTAEINVSFAGVQQKFNISANMRIDNIEKGSYPYTVTVNYFIAGSGEKDMTYSGSGTLDIRYPNQKLTVIRIGDRVIIR